MGESYTDIAFTHEKSNNSRLYPPFGLRFSNEDQAALFERIELGDFGTELSKSLPIRTRIREELKTGKLMTAAEIAEELQVSLESVSMALKRGNGTAFMDVVEPNGQRQWRLR